MSEQYETANIKYCGLMDKGLTVFVVDENKKNWVVWKKGYQTQEDSEPYASLQSYKFGDTFGVSFKETDEEFTGKDGKQVKFKKKTIYSIMPPISQPTAIIKPQAQKTSPQPVYAPTNEDKQTNWDEIAVGKCQSLFIAAFLQSGKTFSEAKLQVTQARQLAELVVYGSQQTPLTLEKEDAKSLADSIPF